MSASALTKTEPAPLDTSKARNQIHFIFTCSDCETTEHNKKNILPDGWDKLNDCGGKEVIRCPDCNEAMERKKIAEIQARLCDHHEEQQAKALPTHELEVFGVALEKQDSGEYRIAMLPQGVLMRWYPLGFFLTPAEAHKLADDLHTFAFLAERPGTLPRSKGDAK